MSSHRSPYAKGICADDYEFHCSSPDCAEHAHDVEDFLKCDGCGALLCMEHKHSPQLMPYLHFCEACFRCVRCGEPAWAVCEECGDLRCQAHTAVTGPEVAEDGWQYGDPTYLCGDECISLHAKSVQRETQVTLEQKRA